MKRKAEEQKTRKEDAHSVEEGRKVGSVEERRDRKC